jgi:hypothetical protein
MKVCKKGCEPCYTGDNKPHEKELACQVECDNNGILTKGNWGKCEEVKEVKP